MKPAYTLSLAAALAAIPFIAGCASKKYDTSGGTPAPVTSVTTTAPVPVTSGATTPPAAADQRVYQHALVLAPQARAGEIINDFRPAYEKLGSPRLVFYINRDLKNPAKPSAKTTPASPGKGVVATTNPLADKQTARDIERIAGRPFIQAGATLVDQEAASATASETAPSADVAVETLVTSRQVVLPSVSGANETVTIPDIQMTAIRLSDAAILGQATANDIVNQLPPSLLSNLNVQDALEATALNLMADITARAK